MLTKQTSKSNKARAYNKPEIEVEHVVSSTRRTRKLENRRCTTPCVHRTTTSPHCFPPHRDKTNIEAKSERPEAENTIKSETELYAQRKLDGLLGPS